MVPDYFDKIAQRCRSAGQGRQHILQGGRRAASTPLLSGVLQAAAYQHRHQYLAGHLLCEAEYVREGMFLFGEGQPDPA